MTGICRLHGVHRQGSDRIDTRVINRVQAFSSIFLHHPFLLSECLAKPGFAVRRLSCLRFMNFIKLCG
jgi:hypothetical protein